MIFGISVEKAQLSLKSDKNNGYYFTWRRVYVFDNISLNFSEFSDTVAEKFKTYILCSVISFWKFCPVLCYVENYGRARLASDDNIIRRMRFVCWINKATNAHWQYILLIAFGTAKQFREYAAVLHYTYITWLFYIYWVKPLKDLCKAGPLWNQYLKRKFLE
jgi:hypothetical protein